jgi:hypothetical protein
MAVRQLLDLICHSIVNPHPTAMYCLLFTRCYSFRILIKICTYLICNVALDPLPPRERWTVSLSLPLPLCMPSQPTNSCQERQAQLFADLLRNMILPILQAYVDCILIIVQSTFCSCGFLRAIKKAYMTPLRFTGSCGWRIKFYSLSALKLETVIN